MRVEAKLEALGLVRPVAFKTPRGLALPFTWVQRLRDTRAHVSAHAHRNPDARRVADELAPRTHAAWKA